MDTEGDDDDEESVDDDDDDDDDDSVEDNWFIIDGSRELSLSLPLPLLSTTVEAGVIGPLLPKLTVGPLLWVVAWLWNGLNELL